MSSSCRLVAVAAVLLGLAPVANATPRDRTVVRHDLLGRSADGRPIRIVELGDPDESRKLLVVGCIHGNEPAGIAAARRLELARPPMNADVWVVEDLNPDGVAARTRQNGRGVDLNRNFPWHWRPLGRPGSVHYSGPRPLSERESLLAYRLILRLRPAVTIWFHQALGVVDLSGGNIVVERTYAKLVGLPLVRLSRYPGSAASWQNHALPGTTAFVVELRAGPLDAGAARRFAGAALALAGPDPDGR